jgi:hypothetical protein
MFSRFKLIAAYLFAIPLALILGFLAASPGEVTFMLIGMLLFFLALPLFLKWHHALLIIFWNSAFNAFFLPGQPYFWLLFGAISFSLSALSHIMGRKPFLVVPEMNRPLLLLVVVVAFTAWYRGGIGLKSLGGSAHGGKYYIFIFGAIIGYFAFTAGQIPMAKSGRMTALFFVSGATFILSNLAYTLGESFYFMFYLVPAGAAMAQAASDYGFTDIDRIQGLVQTSSAILCFMLAYYGIRDIFRPTKPWRVIFLLITIASSLFAGFRSAAVLLILIFGFQFYFEGLFRTRIFPVLIAIGIVAFGVVVLYANRMPLSVQRAISFLPVNIDAEARADATGSSEWRLQMWSIVWKEVPKYLVVGKGYSFDPSEMELTTLAIRMGILSSFEEAIMAGDYHSGPLSVLVPFGVAGAIAFLWVLIAGFRVLHANFRHGDPALHKVNTTLLAVYLAQVACFVLIFGAFSTQLFVFLGLVGFSVSLNGGMAKAPATSLDRARGAVSQAYAIELT